MQPFRILVLIFTVTCVFSCTKDEVTDNGPKRLKRIIKTYGDSILYTRYEYDANNKVISVTDSNSKNILYLNQRYFEYDVNGNVMRITTHYKDGQRPTNVSLDTFVYNNGHITEQLTKLQNDTYRTYRKFTTDIQGRVITDSIIIPDNILFGYAAFTYDNQDNVIEWKSFYKGSNGFIPHETNTATYENSMNGAFLWSQFNFHPYAWYSYSKHNAKKAVYLNGDNVEYTYEYDKDGNAVKAFESNTYGGVKTNGIIDYMYEQY